MTDIYYPLNSCCNELKFETPAFLSARDTVGPDNMPLAGEDVITFLERPVLAESSLDVLELRAWFEK